MKKRKKILFYYSNNKSSISIETLLEEWQKRGYEVLFVSTLERGAIHSDLEKYGISCWAHPVKTGKLYYIRQILYLVRFCWQHRPDIVYSNLQHANVIACVAQFFFPSRLIVARHHFDFVKAVNGISYTPPPNELLFDRIINSLARIIIVPSSGVYNGMKHHEKVDMTKVYIIPYIYDFSKYPKPNAVTVKQIREKYPAKLLLLASMRLMVLKRHRILFELVAELLAEGYDLQLLCLDNGPEKENLLQFIQENNLQDKIHLLGFQTDYINYMAASDMLLHPSLTEASNSVVKELGMLEKPVVVCQGVGDFDDYIDDQESGFLVSRENTKEEIRAIIMQYYGNLDRLADMGKKLRQSILEKFNRSEKVLQQYDKLFE